MRPISRRHGWLKNLTYFRFFRRNKSLKSWHILQGRYKEPVSHESLVTCMYCSLNRPKWHLVYSHFISVSIHFSTFEFIFHNFGTCKLREIWKFCVSKKTPLLEHYTWIQREHNKFRLRLAKSKTLENSLQFEDTNLSNTDFKNQNYF